MPLHFYRFKSTKASRRENEVGIFQIVQQIAYKHKFRISLRIIGQTSRWALSGGTASAIQFANRIGRSLVRHRYPCTDVAQ